MNSHPNNHPNPKLIGAFVLGAVALAVAAVGVLGSGKLYRNVVPFVLFFPSSVEGLAAGAPVKFKGVEVGRVSNILLNLDRPESSDAKIPVFIEIDMDKVVRKGGPPDFEDPEVVRSFIDRGLRAELESQSLLTGQLFVELDFHPDIPARLVQPPDYRYREIPTIPNTLDRAGVAAQDLLEQLRRANLPALVRRADQTLASINSLVASPLVRADLAAVGTTLRHADRTMADIDDTAKNIQRQLAPLSASWTTTAEQTRQTVARVEVAVDRAGNAITQMQSTLAAVQAQIEPDSPIAHELIRTLDETAAAARSVRQLADYLQRNPSSLVFGRGGAGGPK